MAGQPAPVQFEPERSGRGSERQAANERALREARLPAGMGVTWYGEPSEIPSGYLVRDGSTQGERAYPALAGRIGKRYGDAPPGSFRLPADQPTVGIGLIKT